MFKLIAGIVFYAVAALLVFGAGVAVINIRSKKVRPAVGAAMIFLSLVILLAITLPYFVILRGIYAASNIVVGEYTGRDTAMGYWADEKWEIGANRYGEPVFRHSGKAFRIAKKEFKELTDLMDEEYDLGAFSEVNYEEYAKHLWSMPGNKQPVKEHRSHLAEFLRYYENGKKRWHWLPAEGWQRN